jgi:hypothetical protein
VAITHWLLNNNIRRDRYTGTRFIKEISKLSVVNKIYKKTDECQAGQGIPAFFDNHFATQDSIEKESEIKSTEDVSRSDYGSRKEDSAEFSTAPCGKLENELTNEKSTELSLYRKSLDRRETLNYLSFLQEVRLYFLSLKRTSEYERFVKYNEKRLWLGKDGENVRDNYRKYVDEWLEKKKEFFGE